MQDRSERGSPLLKRCRPDLPLEGALLQALKKELEDESRVRVIRYGRKHLPCPVL